MLPESSLNTTCFTQAIRFSSVHGLSLWKRSYVENFKALLTKIFFFSFYCLCSYAYSLTAACNLCWMSSIKIMSFRSHSSCFWRACSYIFCIYGLLYWRALVELSNNSYQLFQSAQMSSFDACVSSYIK